MMMRMFVRGKGGVAPACAQSGRAVIALLLAASGLLTSCAGTDDDGTAQAATTTSTSTVAPTTTSTSTTTTTTTLPPTTSTSTTTTTSTTSTTTTTTSTTTTTTTTTTLPRQATQPIAPPTDNGKEPVVVLGRLMIPKIGVDMPLYEGIRLSTLDLGPGHWPGTAMPGEIGNVVVGGHRTSKHRVFRHIDELVAGDQIIFEDPDGTQHVYLVNRIEIVNPTDVWIINPTDTPTATLFACHPPGSTRQRIVVFADLQV